MSLVTHETFHLVFILIIRVFETHDRSICKTLDHLESREYSHSNILYF